MARRRTHEERDNHERWLVSYADFITLLFAFFVVMYSISSINEGKYRVLSDSLMAAFRDPTRTTEPVQLGRVTRAVHETPSHPRNPPAVIALPFTTAPATAVAKPIESPLQRIAREVEQAMGPLIDEGMVAVRAYENFLEVEIKSSILFDSGSARLSPAAGSTLGRIGRILAPFPNPVRVEGYTDDVPIATERFPSNWELSAGRAATVVQLFVSQGLDPTRLSAVGYGEFRPVADNSNGEGRAQNRRVVLVVLTGEDVRRVLSATRAAVRQEGGRALDGVTRPSGDPGEAVLEPEPRPTDEQAMQRDRAAAVVLPFARVAQPRRAERGTAAVAPQSGPGPEGQLQSPIQLNIVPVIDLGPALPVAPPPPGPPKESVPR